MRGGAIPILAWAILLAVLMAGNWIWTGDAIQIGEFGFAVLAIVLTGLLLISRCREAIRRGPPEPSPRARVEAIPDLSIGAAMAAIALASIGFGLDFGRFLIYFGFGLLALSLGRLGVELRATRESGERYRAAVASAGRLEEEQP
jgi:hypothetical protein